MVHIHNVMMSLNSSINPIKVNRLRDTVLVITRIEFETVVGKWVKLREVGRG